jgi:SAM-dependent methyltransferase
MKRRPRRAGGHLNPSCVARARVILPPMASTNRLILNRFVHRLVTNPLVFRLLFTSFVTKRFAAQTRLLGGDDWLFFNYGYEEDPPMALPLAASEEPDRFPIQLYHRTATQVDLAGKKALEVSCGHGGGASYLMRTLHPASYTGLDLNTVGIEFCRKRHNLPGLDFVQGNATSLPFPDQSFDAVINVEAAINYQNVPRFFAEVERVLRAGGHFLYADIRYADEIAAWEAELAGIPMRLVSEQVINAEVMRGLERNRLLDQITRRLPNIAFPRGIANDYAGGPGSLIYRRLENGEASYRLFCFAKD